MPVLSLIIVVPLLGALFVVGFPDNRYVQRLATWIAALELLLSFMALVLFNRADAGFQLQEHYAWIPTLNIAYSVGIDGLSILFLPMTALLTLLAILACQRSILPLTRLHFALLLVLESMSMGIFCALDMVLFFLFWELTLVPILFLIGLWGIGSKRRAAAVKYVLLMLFGGLFLLAAILLLAINHAEQMHSVKLHDLSFDLPVLLETFVPESLQVSVFFLFLLGFAVKAPLVPFHTWLPQVALEGPTQLTALLVGLKLGLYGILRLALPLVPSAAVEYSWVLGVAGAVALIYGILIALQQANLRRLMAYTGISHVGMVLIGLSAFNIQGLQGAVLQLINFSMIAGALMLLAGFIQQRLGSTELVHLGGLAKTMPRLTVCYFILAFASMGMPLTSGFPAELLLIIGTLLAHPSLGVTTIAGAILGAAAVLLYSRRAFLGPVLRQDVAKVEDLSTAELGLLSVPILFVLAFGLAPNVLLSFNEKTAEDWLARILEQPNMENSEVVGVTLKNTASMP
ncbi:complex I subunit 4 family protein [Methylocucumis oryzae]|uniref:NADH-quinone oxidoreductase subunit M n=1 Tax=Methylocucumis oryzae TaxID=1632867 RepID=A0A0F3IL76_9GAMM|nr:NADH-quinone oxidoreductase subunit M [Methylocucumis oryzae]KJV07278.1 oxidoreductase [Methylocucumis oryzae]